MNVLKVWKNAYQMLQIHFNVPSVAALQPCIKEEKKCSCSGYTANPSQESDSAARDRRRPPSSQRGEWGVGVPQKVGGGSNPLSPGTAGSAGLGRAWR